MHTPKLWLIDELANAMWFTDNDMSIIAVMRSITSISTIRNNPTTPVKKATSSKSTANSM